MQILRILIYIYLLAVIFILFPTVYTLKFFGKNIISNNKKYYIFLKITLLLAITNLILSFYHNIWSKS